MAIYQHALPAWQEHAAAKLDAYLGDDSRNFRLPLTAGS
jgi:hypothetical protein